MPAAEILGDSQTKFSGSDDPGIVAWLDDNSGGDFHEVEKLKPNGLGLYDMTGNVHEFCLSNGEVGNDVPVRGGSFVCAADEMLLRINCTEGAVNHKTLDAEGGFRIVRNAN